MLLQLRNAAKSDPAAMKWIGFSAWLSVTRKASGEVTRINTVRSIDVVIDPARGGKFLQSPDSSSLLNNPDSSSLLDNPTHPKGNKLMAEPTSNPPDPASQAPAVKEQETVALALQGAQEKIERIEQQGQAAKAVLLQMCAQLLVTGLASSKLPEPSQAIIRKHFQALLDAGKTFEPTELQAAIDEKREELAALTASVTVQGPGRIANMVVTEDRLAVAVDDMFGVPHDEKVKNIKAVPLTGIRELYMMLTGDHQLRGGYYPESVHLATTADFTGLVKNALNKIVAQQWEYMGRAGYDWWQKIVKIEHFNTLNTITGILMGTVGTLPSVEERGEYTELVVGDSPETASFTKYGGYIPLTLELIDRDETRKLKAYAQELGNAALRRISSLVAAVFSSNSGVGPTMTDTGALFNATAVTTAGGHANLLTTALSAAQWETVCQAVYNQPLLVKNETGYYGTGSKMAVEPRFLLVPRALKLTAMKIIYPAMENTAQINSENLQRGQIGDVVVVPDWTDATDWAAVIDPNIVPGIVVGERFGLKPEIYIAGNETDPAVFMNDEHRIKVRMFNAVLVQDFRPLHKSNVA
jgi:hypothetical protein